MSSAWQKTPYTGIHILPNLGLDDDWMRLEEWSGQDQTTGEGGL